MNTPNVMPASQSEESQRVLKLFREIVDAIMTETQGPAESEVIAKALALAAGYFLVLRLKYEDRDLSENALRDRVGAFIRQLASYTDGWWKNSEKL